jgi:hypothetical protein
LLSLAVLLAGIWIAISIESRHRSRPGASRPGDEAETSAEPVSSRPGPFPVSPTHADAAADAGGASAASRPDAAAGREVARKCERTIDEACQGYPERGAGSMNRLGGRDCAPSWSAVQADCAPFRGAEYPCGPYNVRLFIDVDVRSYSFYERASGSLVAVIAENLAGATCIAGPPAFIQPSCPDTRNENLWSPCPDAGTGNVR